MNPKVHVMIPFATDKQFGKALNEMMAFIPDDDFVCFLDHDVLLLTPDAITHLHEYARLYPDSLLTCYTNRVGWKPQCLNGIVSENDSIRVHILKAQKQKILLYQVEELKTTISGFLMMFSKKLWNDCSHFTEDKQILGVDNNWSARVLQHGYKIHLMKGLYVWHSYRLLDRQDKSHLK